MSVIRDYLTPLNYLVFKIMSKFIRQERFRLLLFQQLLLIMLQMINLTPNIVANQYISTKKSLKNQFRAALGGTPKESLNT